MIATDPELNPELVKALKWKAHKDVFGKKLTDCTDVAFLQMCCAALWCLLDDIDTADGIFKENDSAYRKYVQATQQRRFQQLTSDGYSLYLPLPRAKATK